MSLRTCIVDLRGAMSKAERQLRTADMALVAPTWTLNPFVRITNVGPHTAPGWGEYDGVVPHDSLSSDASLLSEAHPFPDGKPLVFYAAGKYRFYLLNLASPGAGETFADMLLERCSWMKLCCFDGFSNPGWLLEQWLVEKLGGYVNWNARTPEEKDAAWRMHYPWATNAFYADWNAGLRMMANRVRQVRPDVRVFAYAWNTNPVTSALDGIFLEDRYVRTMPITTAGDVVSRIAADTRRTTEAILEMRVLESYSAQKRAEIEAVCEQQGWYLSRGKDAGAVGG